MSEFILKASSEIIGHSMGRTIWLSKQREGGAGQRKKRWTAEWTKDCCHLVHLSKHSVWHFLLNMRFKQTSEGESSETLKFLQDLKCSFWWEEQEEQAFCWDKRDLSCGDNAQTRQHLWGVQKSQHESDTVSTSEYTLVFKDSSLIY